MDTLFFYSPEGSLGDQLGTSTDTPNVPENFGEVSQNFLQTSVARAETGASHAEQAPMPTYYSLWFWVAILIIMAIARSYASRISKK